MSKKRLCERLCTCRSQPLASQPTQSYTRQKISTRLHGELTLRWRCSAKHTWSAYAAYDDISCSSLLSKFHDLKKEKPCSIRVYSWVYRHDWGDFQAPRNGCLLGWFIWHWVSHIIPTKSASMVNIPLIIPNINININLNISVYIYIYTVIY